jgi:peptidoglycan/LPS O-acetylase OafA/YrhL
MNTPQAKDRKHLFPYYPALDGLRGYFLIVVVMYHFSGGALFGGALLTMSGFFVLSGFLIASLLIAEYLRDDRLDIKMFLIRRARRLLPASMITIAFVAIFWNLFDLRDPGGFDPEVIAHNTNMNLLTASVYMQNWHVINGPEWGGLGAFGVPNPPEASPIGHFWSLAVEEQFYIVFPFVAAATLGFLGGRMALGIVSLLGMALSIGLQPTLDGLQGIDIFTQMTRIYEGTDVRAAEFLLGSVMAVVFSYPAAKRWITTSRLVNLVGVITLLFITYLIFVTKILTAELYVRGGFAMVGALFGIVILSLTQTGTMLSKLLENKVLQWLGVRSYGYYVYHFTLLQLVDREQLGWPDELRIALLVVLTLIIGALSYTYLETPIRRGHWPWKRAGRT